MCIFDHGLLQKSVHPVLSAVHNINIAITTNIDLQIPLYLLLEQVTDELEVDAADVLLLDEEAQQLVFVAGQGFKSDALKYTKLDIGQGMAGRAAETGEVIHINNLDDELTSLHESPLIKDEKYQIYTVTLRDNNNETNTYNMIFYDMPFCLTSFLQKNTGYGLLRIYFAKRNYPH